MTDKIKTRHIYLRYWELEKNNRVLPSTNKFNVSVLLNADVLDRKKVIREVIKYEWRHNFKLIRVIIDYDKNKITYSFVDMDKVERDYKEYCGIILAIKAMYKK